MRRSQGLKIVNITYGIDPLASPASALEMLKWLDRIACFKLQSDELNFSQLNLDFFWKMLNIQSILGAMLEDVGSCDPVLVLVIMSVFIDAKSPDFRPKIDPGSTNLLLPS